MISGDTNIFSSLKGFLDNVHLSEYAGELQKWEGLKFLWIFFEKDIQIFILGCPTWGEEPKFN